MCDKLTRVEDLAAEYKELEANIPIWEREQNSLYSEAFAFGSNNSQEIRLQYAQRHVEVMARCVEGRKRLDAIFPELEQSFKELDCPGLAFFMSKLREHRDHWWEEYNRAVADKAAEEIAKRREKEKIGVALAEYERNHADDIW